MQEQSLTLAKLFGEGCMLQRDVPVAVWGWAPAGESVTVICQSSRAQATANAEGYWRVTLDPLEFGGPFRLAVSTPEESVVRSCYVGDVFLCSGQSNMELPMGWVRYDDPQSWDRPADSLLRHCKVAVDTDFETPRADVTEARWVGCDAATLEEFTAVGYYFARVLRNDLDVPVGLINVSLGGSPIASWMDAASLEDFPWAAEALQGYTTNAQAQERSEQSLKAIADWHDEAERRALEQEPGKWMPVTLPGVLAQQYAWLQDWSGILELSVPVELPETVDGTSVEKLEGLLRLGTWKDSDRTFVNNVFVGSCPDMYVLHDYAIPAGILHAGVNTVHVRLTVEHGSARVMPGKALTLAVGSHSVNLADGAPWRMRVLCHMDGPCPSEDFIRWKPTALYNAMLAPCAGYTVRGVLWYQGESDTGPTHPDYERALASMIALWRSLWKQPRLPFLVVQLPELGVDCEDDGGWPTVRQAEWNTMLHVQDVATVVALGSGQWNDLHPVTKIPVGERLADLALGLVYDGSSLPQPYLDKVETQSHEDGTREFVVRSAALVCDNGAVRECDAVALACGAEPLVFELVDHAGQCHTVAAHIDGSTVRLPYEDQVSEIRYAWHCDRQGALLRSEQGIAVPPARLIL